MADLDKVPSDLMGALAGMFQPVKMTEEQVKWSREVEARLDAEWIGEE